MARREIMRRSLLGLIAAGLTMAAVPSAEAVGLRVSPVIIDMTARQPITTVKVWNDDRQPVGVQIRVFAWHRQGGKDVLQPTRDVVASPPQAMLAPGSQNVIRLARVSSRPLRGVETYRLLIDELPHAHQRPGTVAFLVRQALPITISP
jgi:fimbrial chaperone protein